MLPISKVQNLIDKHSGLERELSTNIQDKKQFAEKSKYYSELNEIIEIAKNYLKFEYKKIISQMKKN